MRTKVSAIDSPYSLGCLLRLRNFNPQPFAQYSDFRVQKSEKLTRLRPIEEIRFISALRHETAYITKIPLIEIGPEVEIEVVLCGFESPHESFIRTQMQLERLRMPVLRQ